MQSLRAKLNDSRDLLHAIEYGNANLRLLELNPAIWEDRDCRRFLKRELAISVLRHWQERHAIDDAVGTPGYSLEFAGRALSFFDCGSANEFIVVAKSELWVYPDDELHHAVSELTDAKVSSLDTFIQSAIDVNSEKGW